MEKRDNRVTPAEEISTLQPLFTPPVSEIQQAKLWAFTQPKSMMLVVWGL